MGSSGRNDGHEADKPTVESSEAVDRDGCDLDGGSSWF